jgi:putative Mg2+ transporter-C (MgtC) family protein
MDVFLEEVYGGFPDGVEMTRVIVRLVLAVAMGAIIGYEREITGKSAGLRTHMLVALGSALFVLAPLQIQMEHDGISRVIQGLAAGIGFIGGGAILKLSDAREVRGLTTAAGIWLTAAVGVTVGLGRIGLALVSTLLTWIILSVIARLEWHMSRRKNEGAPPKTGEPAR